MATIGFHKGCSDLTIAGTGCCFRRGSLAATRTVIVSIAIKTTMVVDCCRVTDTCFEIETTESHKETGSEIVASTASKVTDTGYYCFHKDYFGSSSGFGSHKDYSDATETDHRVIDCYYHMATTART